MSAPRRCSICSNNGHDRRSCPTAKGDGRNARSRGFDPWLDLEYEEHGEAQEIIAAHPDGMTLDEIGQILGLTRERVRQIEVVALRKLKHGIELGETVSVDGTTLPVVVCDRCKELFLREGRAKICADCAPPSVRFPRASKRRKTAVPLKSTIRPIAARVEVPEIPGPPSLPRELGSEIDEIEEIDPTEFTLVFGIGGF